MIDYKINRMGDAELTHDDGREVYLQGDDAADVHQLDAWLDETEFPYGPYETMQDAIDASLSPYFED